jgi:hypothetical protein
MMAFTIIHNGIVFVEGSYPAAEGGPIVECDLSFKFGAQLKSLRDVKDDLARKAKEQGYNAVLEFTYGQKTRWLAIDDVAYWGKGCLANVSQEEYNKIAETLKGQ